jgi:hypothetical protein
MSATVDLIGTTYSTRLGIDSIESGTAIETSDQLCVIDQLDASDATDLPALKRLLEAGATVAVHRGCPMLRVHRVPTHPDAQRWLEQLTCEFGSVRDALQARTSEHVTNNVLAAAAAAREWDDEPLCAMMVPQSESQTGVFGRARVACLCLASLQRKSYMLCQSSTLW